MEKNEAIKVLEAAKLWPETDVRFFYMMLNRMQMDCEYFLGYGERDPGGLWAGDVSRHIEIMKALYAILPERPQWITENDIEEYSNEMTK